MDDLPTTLRSALVVGLLVILATGCSHGSKSIQAWDSRITYTDDFDEGVRTKGGNTASTRIWVLINNGQFAEAEALIAEAKAAGLVAAPEAARMLDRIALLNMRLGQLPATLQRARDFPSRLRDYNLFEIKQMLEKKDFSQATESQLKMAIKLLQNSDRLMEKL